MNPLFSILCHIAWRRLAHGDPHHHLVTGGIPGIIATYKCSCEVNRWNIHDYVL